MDPTPTTVPSTTTTLFGPNGTAPGISFVEQQSKPLNDSSDGRSAGLPLAVAALILLVVFTVVFLRSRRARASRR